MKNLNSEIENPHSFEWGFYWIIWMVNRPYHKLEHCIQKWKIINRKIDIENNTKINFSTWFFGKYLNMIHMNKKSLESSFTYLIESNSFNVWGIPDLVYEIKQSDISLNDLILSEDSKMRLFQIIEEHNNIEKLKLFNWLKPIHKIILEWESWCWKTTSALAIAHELWRWIIIVNLSEIVSSRLWETSKNLNKVIKYAETNNYIIFFDEFDSISRHRNDEKELGEMKRLVNSLIQLLDFSSENILIIWATNNIESIDTAIIRRFEDTIKFRKPWKNEIKQYISMLEFHFGWKVTISKVNSFISTFEGCDYFKIKTLINNAVKKKIIKSSVDKIHISMKDIAY